MSESSPRVLAVCAGNTTVRYGLYHGRDLIATEVCAEADADACARDIDAFRQRAGEDAAGASVVVGASNRVLADALVARLGELTGEDVFRIGEHLPIPLTHTLDDAGATGEDRLLNAVGAFALADQACVIVDAGTAVTVDFIDGQGTFHGGAIGPGLRMSLDALHAGTAALGHLEPAVPDAEVFGRNTGQAMLNGVYYGIRGMVRCLTERYAEAYDAYPLVIATGGDAPMLFESDPIVERIVPDLTLRGIVRACAAALEDEAESPEKLRGGAGA